MLIQKEKKKEEEKKKRTKKNDIPIEAHFLFFEQVHLPERMIAEFGLFTVNFWARGWTANSTLHTNCTSKKQINSNNNNKMKLKLKLKLN